MNINALPQGIPVDWRRTMGAEAVCFGLDMVVMEFPKANKWPVTEPRKQVPLNLHGSNLGRGFRLRETYRPPKGWVETIWMGLVETKAKEVPHSWWDSRYPFLLELGCAPEGSEYLRYARTPRGTPGYPAAILFNEKGRLVKNVLWNPYCLVRFVLLNPEYVGFGWDSDYPAVALWFVDQHSILYR